MSTTDPTPTPQPMRAPSPFKSVSCPASFEDLCTAMITYGRELEKWGNDVLGELDALKAASNGSGGVGTPPQDATQPPPPPFKK